MSRAKHGNSMEWALERIRDMEATDTARRARIAELEAEAASNLADYEDLRDANGRFAYLAGVDARLAAVLALCDESDYYVTKRRVRDAATGDTK